MGMEETYVVRQPENVRYYVERAFFVPLEGNFPENALILRSLCGVC